jgi:transcriptional regulator GlxA family with amidase domain
VEYADAKTFSVALKKMRVLTDWLQRQHAADALLAANGTGVFALAEAGLLDHRDATIGRLLEKIFHRRYPAVRLQSRSAVTATDNIFCAATLPAMLPLVQSLLERFTSPMIAHQTRRALQLDEQNNSLPDQPVSNVPAAPDEIIAKAQYWMQHNLAGNARLAELAEYAAVSERTLIRHFKQVLGVTPHAYLQTLRMETAKRFLERTDLSIDQVAERVGYGNTAFFRRSFGRCVGSTPTAYRAKARAAMG